MITFPLDATLMAVPLCYVGSAFLALAMARHFEHGFERDPSPAEQWGLRTLALAALSGALLCCMQAWGVAIGLVAWFGFLAAGALCWTLAWGCRQRMALGLIPVALMSTALAVLLS